LGKNSTEKVVQGHLLGLFALHYYHYMINWNDEKIYKLHNSTKSCGPADIISHFSTKDRIFTKNERICKASLKKIQKEYYMYTGKKIKINSNN
jgi:hypothetical protein